MWLVKKATEKVYTISQNILKQETFTEKQIKDIISNKHEVMPIKKMGELASQSFQMVQFEQIINFISEKLKDLKFQRKSLKKKLNLLVLHGASGFIDEFREMKNTFKVYQDLSNSKAEQDQRIRTIIQQIRERTKYIILLLFDKLALLRQKQVAQLIKAKIILKNGDFNPYQTKEEVTHKTTGDKVEDFLQHYVWRYTQKLDNKLDEITDILIKKIDEYLDDQMPQNFDIDDVQHVSITVSKTQTDLNQTMVNEKQKEFIKQKLPIVFNQVNNTNKMDLMNLQGVSQKTDDLIQMQTIVVQEPRLENTIEKVNYQSKMEILSEMTDKEIEEFRLELVLESNKQNDTPSQ